jgi:amino acid transporter
MATPSVPVSSIDAERRKLKRELTLLPLFGLIYFTVCGGSFGIEPLVGWSGPGLAILLCVLTPLIFSIPIMLMVRELQSMMPVEGGYYHWIKAAFGPFAGFMAGWMNWVVSWVDVAIYPVLAVYYLGYFIPALRQGTTIGGLEIPASLLAFLVTALLIWGISALQVRGARLAGLTTTWLGAIMLIPLVILALLGIYSWIKAGTPVQLPFLGGGQTLTAALSTGLFVVMWNYMGWELPAAAGDEIVNPRKTYPRAMFLVLIAAILTYMLPLLGGLYGGAADDGRYQVWGIEEYDQDAGIGPVLADYGVTEEQIASWGVDPTSSVGWEFPDIGHAIAAKVFGADSPIAGTLGLALTIAAVLSMIGLFIGNSLGGTRVPFALAEDGMMPKWLVKVHPRYGTPWIAILLCAVIFTVFSLQAFAFLVVVDVFLQTLVILAEFAAMWRLRRTRPDVHREKVPGGYLGLAVVTILPTAIIALAIYSQVAEEGLSSLGMALVAIAVGAVIYFPIRRVIKPGKPDIDPFEKDLEAEGVVPVLEGGVTPA